MVLPLRICESPHFLYPGILINFLNQRGEIGGIFYVIIPFDLKLRFHFFLSFLLSWITRFCCPMAGTWVATSSFIPSQCNGLRQRACVICRFTSLWSLCLKISLSLGLRYPPSHTIPTLTCLETPYADTWTTITSTGSFPLSGQPLRPCGSCEYMLMHFRDWVINHRMESRAMSGQYFLYFVLSCMLRVMLRPLINFQLIPSMLFAPL